MLAVSDSRVVTQDPDISLLKPKKRFRKQASQLHARKSQGIVWQNVRKRYHCKSDRTDIVGIVDGSRKKKSIRKSSCIDLQDLSKALMRPHYPLKTLNEDKLTIPSASFFILDAKSAFRHIKLQLHLWQISLYSNAIRNNIRIRSILTSHWNADRTHTIKSDRSKPRYVMKRLSLPNAKVAISCCLRPMSSRSCCTIVVWV